MFEIKEDKSSCSGKESLDIHLIQIYISEFILIHYSDNLFESKKNQFAKHHFRKSYVRFPCNFARTK